jgi:hypothetical protein
VADIGSDTTHDTSFEIALITHSQIPWHVPCLLNKAAQNKTALNKAALNKAGSCSTGENSHSNKVALSGQFWQRWLWSGKRSACLRGEVDS